MPRSHELPEVPTVFVTDPDPTTGQTIRKLLDGTEIGCEFYRSGREFLAAYRDDQPGCLVLEQRIPDMSGLQLQHRLAASGAALPLIFVTARPDISTAVEFMRGGAVHVLEKPVRTAELLEAIQEAIALDRGRRHAKNNQKRLKDLTDALTRKERQVLELIAAGKSVKAIAAALELSVRAVELRRKSLMKKLEVRSTLELMRFSVLANRELGAGSDAIPTRARLLPRGPPSAGRGIGLADDIAAAICSTGRV
jgi:two-component system, LuxR family, response regulator FixJ